MKKETVLETSSSELDSMLDGLYGGFLLITRGKEKPRKLAKTKGLQAKWPKRLKPDSY